MFSTYIKMRNFFAVSYGKCVVYYVMYVCFLFSLFDVNKGNTYDDFDSLRTRLGSCFFISDSLTASVNDLKTVLCVLFKCAFHSDDNAHRK